MPARVASSAGTPATVVDLLDRVFRSAPDRLALVFLENGESEAARLTRGELRANVLNVAATLQSITSPGDRALLVYPSGLDFAIGYLACLYAGIVPVPCYPPSRNRVDHRLASIAASSEARLVLTSDKVGAAPGARFEGYPALSNVHWLSTSRIDPAAGARWAPPSITGDTTGLMQYTSGSTSEPRGVVVSHTNLLASFRDMDFGHDDDSVMVTWLPLFHDLGLIFGLLQPLADGFPCVLMPPAAFLQQPVRWLRALTKYRGTHSAAPNFAFDLCVSRVAAATVAELDLSRWTFALNAAEPVRADTIERFSAHFADAGFKRRTFSPGFGLAEATLRVTATPQADQPVTISVDPEALKQHRVVRSGDASAMTLVSSGIAVDHTIVRVVDPETMQPCAADRIGEIWVGGRTVAQGYFNNPDATTATFGARLDGEPTPFMRTGDLGFLIDGWIFITGRLKDVIILRGLNYYPQDLERTVEQCHPSLAAAGAAAFSVEVDGEERLAIVAEVARTHRRNVDTTAVYAAMQQALSETHGIAVERIALIDPHTLPKTSSGKVRRKACRDALREGTLSTIAEWDRPPVTMPQATAADRGRGDIRKWLVTRLAARRGCAPSAIDPRASMAQFGLDSITAVELSDELERALGRPVPATAFYDFPTIDALADHLAGAALDSDAANNNERSAARAIAVIGIGCRFPGADSPEQFWRLLERGVDAVGPLTIGRAGKGANAPGGYLDQVDRFDAEFFGISPREAERMDPQQRLVLEVGWEALEDAGMAAESIAGSRTGVFLGIANSDYSRLLIDANPADMYLGTGSSLTIAANRLSYLLDLKGPSLAVDTACSSSLVAIALAAESLRRGECDLALSGGVNLILTPHYTEAFAAAGMLAADGRCKAFADEADGYVRGEGAGLVLLKRLEDAERDGDRILAVVRGVATNQDGRSAGLTAPNGPSQQEVVRAALRDAGVAAARVSYVEAHGTGTALGDPIEVNALAAVLGVDRAGGSICRVGSVKTNIGHLETAAGIAGLIKTVLSLQHREIPASLHCRSINPRIELGDHIAINTSHREWATVDDEARIAGVSSFGFGGTNAHVVLEEYRPTPTRRTEPAPHVLTLSARSTAALNELADRYITALESANAVDFADAAFTSNVGRSAMSERVAVVATTAAEAATTLRQWRARDSASHRHVRRGTVNGHATPGIVFLYTGQGANYPGMGLDLYRSEPVFGRAIDECSAIVEPELGTSVATALETVSPDDPANMVISQSCLFAVEYALTRLWTSWGVRPAAVIGHSLGEFAAAVAAGSIDVGAAARLVILRARLLQSIAEDGAMVAVAADHDTVARVIAPWAKDLSIAAVNGPANVVFSGRRDAANAAAAQLKALRIRHVPLTVAQAFHSPLVDPLLDPLSDGAAHAAFVAARIPFISTVSGTTLATAPDAGYWRTQLRAPVLFMQAINNAIAEGFNLFLEVGPHPTLSTLGAEISGDRGAIFAASMHRDRTGSLQLRDAAAQLWAAGASIDWRAADANRAVAKVSLPTYAFQRTSHWIGNTRDTGSEAAPSRAASSHAYEVQWIERAASHHASASGLGWMIFADTGGTGDAVAKALRQRGDRVTLAYRATRFAVRDDRTIELAPSSTRDYAQAFAHAIKGGRLDRIAHLWSLDASGEPSIESLRAAVDDGALSVLHTLQAIQHAAISPRLHLITRRATAAGSGLDDHGILQSATWGIARNLAVEHPDLWGSVIDLDDDAPLDDLIAELTADSAVDDQVSFRGGRRLVCRVTPSTLPAAGRAAIDPHASYIITGGLGAVGLAVAQALIDSGARRLVLASRGGVTSEERQAAVRALSASGATIDTPAIDVSDEPAVRSLIDSVSARTRLAGIVHAAGEAGFATMTEMTPEAFASVFRAKAEGALALARATAALPIDFFVCVSSMSSVWAGEGQAHYVAANHFVDMLAHRLRQLGRAATSLGFGPLRGGLMPAAIAERLTRNGVATWELSKAASMVMQIAGSSCTHAIAVELDWSVFGKRRASTRTVSTEPAARAGELLDQLRAATPLERDQLIYDTALREAAAVLGMRVDEWGDARRGFFDMGMDSLTAVELRKRFEQLLGRTLPVTLVFDHSNLDALQRALSALLFDAPRQSTRAIATNAPAPVDDVSEHDDSLDATLERLERLVAGQ
jgi:acyl transferase domain-containing protein/acyl-CoA synthetase (AMP-forming)/AMP-acid ligase II/acyl carrier protein